MFQDFFWGIDTVIFMAVAIVGIALLLLTILLDDVLGILDLPSEGFLNVESASALVAGFGAVAWFMSGYLGISPLGSAGIGLLGGLPLAVTSFLLVSFLKRQEVTSGFGERSIEGEVGVVTLAIPSDGLGRIQYTKGGSIHSAIARTAGPISIPQGGTVKVIQVIGGQTIVEPYRVQEG